MERSLSSRRSFLGTALKAGAGLWGAPVLAGCARRDASKPNLILVSIDTLRADHLGCYGYGRPTSPTLDAFASEGLLFEDVSTTSPWTLPAHASLLTGLYPRRHGLKSFDETLPGELAYLPELLHNEGYAVSGVVNTHCLHERIGYSRGFDSYLYEKEKLDLAAPTAVTERALEWLRRNWRGPFFLFLHYYDVHSDYRSLPRYEMEFVRPYRGKLNGTTSQLLLARKFAIRNGVIPLDGADARHLIDLYDAGIRQLDSGIARLLWFLEEKGILEDSLIAITGDHGEEFLEHGNVLHGRTYFEEVLRVPLLLRGPGVPRGKRVDAMASLVDVMPTLLSLLDVPVPARLNGIDLSPAWREDGAELPERFILAEADWQNEQNDLLRAVRSGPYKLIYNRLTGQQRLFDIVSNPRETKNIRSRHRPLVDSMMQWMEGLGGLEDAGAPAPPLSADEVEDLEALGYL